MTKRQIICADCSEDVFLDHLKQEHEGTPALIYACPKCQKTFVVRLDAASGGNKREATDD